MEARRIRREPEASTATNEDHRSPLLVGAVDDPLEHEADVVADRVMATLADGAAAGPFANATTTRIRRMATPQPARRPASASPPGPRIRRRGDGQPIGREGGAVSPDVERQLDAARGGGQALAAEVRSPMERAFGADFSAVRVHEGPAATSLNESLGARAFTLGQDIFMRQPLDHSSSSDQHMLAHELAHTVQQGSGAGRAARTIRRAVGFEFEVGSWTVQDLAIDLTPEELAGTDEVPDRKVDPAGLDKDTVLYAGNNFNLKPDQADDGTWHLEFVVEPPFQENTKARSKVKSTLKEMRKLGDTMIAAGKQAHIRRENDPYRWIYSDDLHFDRLGVFIAARSKMEAEPQVTGGVRMDQLGDLMEKMAPTALPGETGKQTTERTTGAYYMGAKNAGDATLVAASPGVVRNLFTTFPGKSLHSPDTASKELISLLAMIRTYLLKASQGAAYAKSIAPIMARTDFGKMYAHIPEATYYTSYRNEFAELALHVSGLSGQGGQPFFSGASTYTDPAVWLAIQNGLTRQQWLRDIPTGIDRVTEAHFPDRTVAGALFGLGKLGDKVDTVGKSGGSTETEAPIFEFRRMAGFQDHRVWEALSLELFDFFVAVNRRKTTTFKATKTAKQGRSI